MKSMSSSESSGAPRGMTEVDSAPSRADDGTLAGYFRVHDRPPAFEALDGHPYTVSVEAEKTGDLRAPSLGYLVFPIRHISIIGIVIAEIAPERSIGRTGVPETR